MGTPISSLVRCLEKGQIKASDIPGMIPKGFFTNPNYLEVLMGFFERVKLELKEDWRGREDAQKIDIFLQTHTVAQGYGIFELQSNGALSDVLTCESLAAINAFKEVLQKMLEQKGTDDFEFWQKFSHKNRNCRLKDILWPFLMNQNFSEKQKAKLLAKGKNLKYMPEEMRTPEFMKAFIATAGPLKKLRPET